MNTEYFNEFLTNYSQTKDVSEALRVLLEFCTMASEKLIFAEGIESRLEILEQQVADIIASGGGGSGTTDYKKLNNKPRVNTITLEDDKKFESLGLKKLTNQQVLDIVNNIF